VDHVWYVAYGSNLAVERFSCYLSGGRPRGGARVYPGCRNQDPSVGTAAVTVPGALVFAGTSKVWGGGSAFYNPSVASQVAGHAYLLTPDQLADVAAQEMWREPGGPYALELATLLPDVTELHSLGPGRYETVVRLGEHDDIPMYTITHSAFAELDPVAPTASYLQWIATGLTESHNWTLDQVVAYLYAAPGVQLGWTAGALRSALQADPLHG
jgi:hypothetical protein